MARPVPSRSTVGAVAVRWCAALFALSLALAVVGRVAQVEALALLGGYGVLFLGIGAAPFQLRTDLHLYARLTGAILVGFAVLLCAGGVMADIHGLWDPVIAAVITGLPAIGLHVAGVQRARALPRGRGEPADDLFAGLSLAEELGRVEELEQRYPETATRRLEELRGRSRRRTHLTHRTYRQAVTAGWTPARLGLYVSLIGTIFWLAPALWTRDPNPTYWGMLTTINPLWYLGLVTVLVGFALGRRNELSAGLATLSFGLATTLTPALVYGAPRDQTAAKQMQITQYVLAHHHIDVTAGIYQAFSSTFSGVAAFVQLLGIHGMLGHMSLWGLATYWPVLLVPMRVAVLRLLMGRLLPTTSRRWCGVMLVLLVDSLGDDYFSPQAIGYVMAIGIVAVAMNGPRPRPLGTRSTFLLLLVAGVALGPTHELSPYMATGALVILAIFGQAPFWTCLPIGIPALVWAAVVHRAISRHFSFSSLFNIGNFRPPVTVATPGLHRLSVVGAQSEMLLVALLVLILLGAIGLLTNVRKRWAWAYALCPLVGIAFIAINPYGNEGIYRATLFAIPWMAVLAMRMPHPARLLTRRRGHPPKLVRALAHPQTTTIGVALTLTALLATFLIAAYAMDGTNVLPRDNVAVVDYLMRQPPRHAFVLSIGSANNPADGANFTFRYRTLEWSQVAKGVPELGSRHPSAVDATALADRYGLVASAHGSTPKSPLYVIWDRSSRLYANAYALQSSAQMYAWLRVMKASSSWRLVDRAGGTYLFRLG